MDLFNRNTFNDSDGWECNDDDDITAASIDNNNESMDEEYDEYSDEDENINVLDIDLPDIPEYDKNTVDEWNNYACVYIESLAKIAHQLDKWYDLYVTQGQPMDQNEFKEIILPLFKKLTNYFIITSTCEKWTQIILFKTENLDESDNNTKGKTTLRTHLFWELAKLRVIARISIINGNVYKHVNALYFKLLVKQQIISPVLGIKPILQYSQKELNVAFYMLTKIWNTCEYSEELDIYVNLVLDRLSMIFCQSFLDSTMNMDEFRQELVLPDELADALETTPDSWRCEAIINAVSDNIRNNRSSNTINNKMQYGPNFDYVYKSQVLYYWLITPLTGFKDRHKRSLQNKLHYFNNYQRQQQEYREEEQREENPLIWMPPNFLFEWCKNKIKSIHNKFGDILKKRYINMLVPPETREWLMYTKAVQIKSWTPVNMLKHYLGPVHRRLLEDASREPNVIFKKESENSKLKGLYDWMILKLIDKLFGPDVAFFECFVISREDMENEQKMASFDESSVQPLIVQFFSRYYVYYNFELYVDNGILSSHNVTAATTVNSFTSTSASTIYDTMTLWLHFMSISDKGKKMFTKLNHCLREELVKLQIIQGVYCPTSTSQQQNRLNNRRRRGGRGRRRRNNPRRRQQQQNGGLSRRNTSTSTTTAASKRLLTFC